MPLFKPVKSTMGAPTRVRRGGGRLVLPGTTYVYTILGKGLPDPRKELDNEPQPHALRELRAKAQARHTVTPREPSWAPSRHEQGKEPLSQNLPVG